MARFGRNMKWTADRAHREQLGKLFREVLGARSDARNEAWDFFHLDDGFHLGIFYVDATAALAEPDQEKSIWLEFLVADVAGTIRQLDAIGAQRIQYDDKEHAYFRVAGGPVFRLAAEH